MVKYVSSPAECFSGSEPLVLNTFFKLSGALIKRNKGRKFKISLNAFIRLILEKKWKTLHHLKLEVKRTKYLAWEFEQDVNLHPRIVAAYMHILYDSTY